MTDAEVDRALEEMSRIAIAHETAKHNTDWTEALSIAREHIRARRVADGYNTKAGA